MEAKDYQSLQTEMPVMSCCGNINGKRWSLYKQIGIG